MSCCNDARGPPRHPQPLPTTMDVARACTASPPPPATSRCDDARHDAVLAHAPLRWTKWCRNGRGDPGAGDPPGTPPYALHPRLPLTLISLPTASFHGDVEPQPPPPISLARPRRRCASLRPVTSPTTRLSRPSPSGSRSSPSGTRTDGSTTAYAIVR
ncbi:hypothetical protein BJ912DRAFT_966158 [Pholiota molesta]|nr:hypothetical protein BJ912DRAFT_966158 [Pholiota molesta]